MILFLHRKQLRTTDMRAWEWIASRSRPSVHAFVVDDALVAGGRQNSHSGLFFFSAVSALFAQYAQAGATLHVWAGDPVEVVKHVCTHNPIEEVVFSSEVTPYARDRDARITAWCRLQGITVTTIEDDVLVDPKQLHDVARRPFDTPFLVFTPFYKRWRETLGAFPQRVVGTRLEQLHTVRDVQGMHSAVHFLAQFPKTVSIDGMAQMRAFIRTNVRAYAAQRDPYGGGPMTSRLSAYINAGVVSVRDIVAALAEVSSDPDAIVPEAEAWVRQLAWREFYLYQARDPRFFGYDFVMEHPALSTEHLSAWEEARTGVPVVDAAMTELRETGWLHNRLRMIVAMFLTKNLLVPFQYGEAHFRRCLTDYDNVQNRGGWLWSSSFGYDAAPYFRIMNPVLQSKKWDPDGAYIRRWLPALAGDPDIHEPRPNAIVDVHRSRQRAIDVYAQMVRS
ncbi:MAG: DNA photolyase family protein [Paenibacillaceae bacterium]|nr:DNA photolyase family protein [Paenibacillaceae bacterium]